MPIETSQAIEWAMQQEGVVQDGKIQPHELVDQVRQYFNTHNVSYGTFDFHDLEPYLPR